MTVLVAVISCLLALEWVMGPINLWRGRTMPNFVRFTGFAPQVATRVFAPFKLVLAALLIAGLFVEDLSLAGAVGTVAISCVYLLRLAGAERRHLDGVAAFALTALAGVAIAILQLAR
jgi:hypothetical protein